MVEAKNEIEQKDARVRLRPETKVKWDRIQEARRWTATETADALADAYLELHPEIVPEESKASPAPST